MNPARHAMTKYDQLSRARMILRTLGTRAAAGYMRKHGFSLQAALWWLLGVGVRS